MQSFQNPGLPRHRVHRPRQLEQDGAVQASVNAVQRQAKSCEHKTSEVYSSIAQTQKLFLTLWYTTAYMNTRPAIHKYRTWVVTVGTRWCSPGFGKYCPATGQKLWTSDVRHFLQHRYRNCLWHIKTYMNTQPAIHNECTWAVTAGTCLVTKGSAVQKTLPRQTTEILNVSCNPHLEHNTPIFSLETLWLMIINHQTKFGCK